MLLQFGRAGVDKGLWIEHRCVIDEGIEFAETPYRFRDDPCPGGAIGYVVVKKDRGVAEFGGNPLAAFLDVGNRDPRALGHKQPCLGFPLTAGRAVMIATLPLSRPMVFSSASRFSAMALNPFATQIPDDIGMSRGILIADRPTRLPWPLAQGSA
jgi:hypothetical protein